MRSCAPCRWLLMVPLLCATVPSAWAVAFAGGALGEWQDPVATQGVSIVNEDNMGVATLEWGTPAEGSVSSRLQFDGVQGWNATLDELVLIGTLDYRNGAVTATDLSGVDLSVTLELVAPTLASTTYDFFFDIENTPNDCMPLPGCADDRIRLRTPRSRSDFLYDGVAYTLVLAGFSEDGGASITAEFSSPEEGERGAGLYARIQRSVPAPPPAMLLLAGLPVLWRAVRARQGSPRRLPRWA
jgi:hypothetical protein